MLRGWVGFDRGPHVDVIFLKCTVRLCNCSRIDHGFDIKSSPRVVLHDILTLNYVGQTYIAPIINCENSLDFWQRYKHFLWFPLFCVDPGCFLENIILYYYSLGTHTLKVWGFREPKWNPRIFVNHYNTSDKRLMGSARTSF